MSLVSSRRASREASGSETAVAVALRIDLVGEATIPGNRHLTVLGDLADDSAIADLKTGRLVADRDQLDPRSDTDAGPDPSRKKCCTANVHVLCIDQGPLRLDTFLARQEGLLLTSNATGRRRARSRLDG